MPSGIVERLRRAATVHVDSMALIYFVEDAKPWASVLAEVFEALDTGVLRGSSASVTLTEVLVRPLQKGDHRLAAAYRDILQGSLPLVPLDALVAERAARIRVEHNLKTVDAVQLATAVLAGAGAFLTNDKDLRRFDGIDVVILDDFVARPSGA